MVFFRRWLLIVLALLSTSASLSAASREERAYAAAVTAFHDQLYSLAETRLNQFLQSHPKSTNAPAAVLLLAQSEFYLKNYSVAMSRLADGTNMARAKIAGLADSYDYWRAEAQFFAGDVDGAAGTFASLADNYPTSPLALKAVVEAAAAYGRNLNWARVDELLGNTNGLFQRTAQVDPANEQVANGRLVQAESKCAQRDFNGAVGVLSLVPAAALPPELDWKRAHLLYRADIGKKDLDGALAAATNMLQLARLGNGASWSTNFAESVACRAEAFERQGNLTAAGDAWAENYSRTNIPAEQQRRAILKVADLAVAQGNFPKAIDRLEKFLADNAESPAAGAARLRLAELHLQEFINHPDDSNQLSVAQSNLAQVITAEPGGVLAGKAHLDNGWCNWLLATNALALGDTNTARQKFSDSYDDYKDAADRFPRESEDLAWATFKMGDAQFALTNYVDAIGSYRAVLRDFSGVGKVMNTLGDRALYQILRAQLELRSTNELDQTMGELLNKFSGSEATGQGMLLAGEGLSDFGYPAKARALFEQFERERTNSPLMSSVALALARTYEREQKWPETVAHCEAWLRDYPTNTLASQVEYLRNWAVAQAGDENKAFELFTNFLTRYPTNPILTPLARWSVADHYFRLGTNFVAAGTQYRMIFQEFPNSELAGRAQLMAARSAMGLYNNADAIQTLTVLISDTNAVDELRDKARFAYTEACHHLATSETNLTSLRDATNILAQMYAKTPTNIVGALAWSETADCNALLGALDAATNAYAMVLLAPSATVELRCRAHVGLGQVLERKADGLNPEAQRALKLAALLQYTEVIYTTESVSDPFWIKEAALDALKLMPYLEGDRNKFIDRLEHWLPQLTDALEKKRAAAQKT